MYLVQILLPTFDNTGNPILSRIRRKIRDQLTARFGGATSYSRAPAKGTWKRGRDTIRDDIIVMEVMTKKLSRKWWMGLSGRDPPNEKEAELLL
jgi:hypothetical protein